MSVASPNSESKVERKLSFGEVDATKVAVAYDIVAIASNLRKPLYS